jgi:hypothetical protein
MGSPCASDPWGLQQAPVAGGATGTVVGVRVEYVEGSAVVVVALLVDSTASTTKMVTRVLADEGWLPSKG